MNSLIFFSQLLKSMIEKDEKEWPPDCNGWYYQPQRPPCKTNRAEDHIDNFST